MQFDEHTHTYRHIDINNPTVYDLNELTRTSPDVGSFFVFLFFCLLSSHLFWTSDYIFRFICGRTNLPSLQFLFLFCFFVIPVPTAIKQKQKKGQEEEEEGPG